MIYAVNFSSSLSDILAKYLLDKYSDNIFEITKVKVLLPTKRSCQSLRESFLKLQKTEATLLPQIVSLYDMDMLDTSLPPAISNWERLFLLTKLCQAKPNLHEITKAFQVALSLSKLLDLSYQYDVDLSKINTLALDDSFAKHWQETIAFIDIISSVWPSLLIQRNQIDQQDRLQRVIRLKADQMKNSEEKIIIAGLTANFPAVAELMKVAHMKGDIFLDGVDQTFLNSKEIPDQRHPQYSIYKTLQKLNISHDQITFLNQNNSPSEELIEEAFRTDIWSDQNLDPSSVAHIKYIEADSAEQEALTIALKLREVLEIPQKTASFVTTDRTLARRVIAQMKRWDIQLDDSAGFSFKHTPTGSFLLQILKLAINQDSYTEQLALYKHPLFADSQDPGRLRILIKQFEKDNRQNHQPFQYHPNELGDEFFDLFSLNTPVSIKKMLTLHLELAEKWASTDQKNGKEVLTQFDTGLQLYQLLDEMTPYLDILGDIMPQEYPVFFEQILDTQTARHPYGYNQRIKILGLIESRFTHTDVCIIGGLNEQVFPPILDTGPWLNRTMREKLGLPDAEATITEMAHDFMHIAASQELVLTRATKVSGTPTVPSRFLERLQMVCKINHLDLPTYYANLAILVDTPNKIQKIERPVPCPKSQIRPRKLSVTNIELLKRNPYAIYAKYILSLYPLDDWDNPSKLSLYGQAMHNTLEVLISNSQQEIDLNKATEIFHQNLIQQRLSAADCLFFESIFSQKILPFLIQEQTRLQKTKVKTYTEIKGAKTISIDQENYTITARVDRIDINPNGLATIIDYKTGTPPSFSQVLLGASPQLTLEAWLLVHQGFKDLTITSVDDIEYWHIGRHSERKSFKEKHKDVLLNDLIQQTENGLKDLLRYYNLSTTPYEVCPIKSLEPTYNDYAQLARMSEWAHSDEGIDNA